MFSSGKIVVCFCAMISPVSICSLIKNVVTPVSSSPLIIAQWIGAAPRYLGNREACKLNEPFEGIDQTSFGSIRKATTTNTSALCSFNSETNDSSFKLGGCKMGRFFSVQKTLIGDAVNCFPLPDFLSCAVTTAITSCSLSRIFCKGDIAKAGVPIYMIRSGFIG